MNRITHNMIPHWSNGQPLFYFDSDRCNITDEQLQDINSGKEISIMTDDVKIILKPNLPFVTKLYFFYDYYHSVAGHIYIYMQDNPWREYYMFSSLFSELKKSGIDTKCLEGKFKFVRRVSCTYYGIKYLGKE